MGRQLWCRPAFALVLLFATATPGVRGDTGQERIEASGAFTEPLSALEFPVRMEDWERTRILKYPDRGGHSVTYQLRADGVSASGSVYIYPEGPPWPATLQDHYAETVKELLSLGRGAELVKEDADPIERDGRTIERRFAAILCRDGIGPTHGPTFEILTLSKIGSYWLKWRISAPMTVPQSFTARFAALMAAFVPQPR